VTLIYSVLLGSIIFFTVTLKALSNEGIISSYDEYGSDIFITYEGIDNNETIEIEEIENKQWDGKAFIYNAKDLEVIFDKFNLFN
jgi:hypothetical protein